MFYFSLRILLRTKLCMVGQAEIIWISKPNHHATFEYSEFRLTGLSETVMKILLDTFGCSLKFVIVRAINSHYQWSNALNAAQMS